SSGSGSQPEIHVKSFPSGEGHWQVSTKGGIFPRWRGDSKELFFQTTAGGKFAAVSIRGDGATLQHGDPEELFESKQPTTAPPGHSGHFHVYAVSPDGQRFLIPRPASELEGGNVSTPITIVLNWTALLKR